MELCSEKSIYTLSLMAVLVSFLGFLVENIWLALTKGFIDNRNMTFPFLLGYGLFITGMFVLFGTPENLALFGHRIFRKTKKRQYIEYIIIAFVVVSVGEIILGKLVETFFGFEYWNYSALPLHITKYTSVFTSLGFALIITFFMGKCFNPVFSAISSVPLKTAKKISAFFSALLITDFIVSFRKMYKKHGLNVRWRKEISLKNKNLHMAE